MDNESKCTALFIDDKELRVMALLDALSPYFICHLMNFDSNELEMESEIEDGMMIVAYPPENGYDVIFIHSRNKSELVSYKGKLVVWYGGYGSKNDLDIPSGVLAIYRSVTGSNGHLTDDEAREFHSYVCEDGPLPSFLREPDEGELAHQKRRAFMKRHLQNPDTVLEWPEMPDVFRGNYEEEWNAFHQQTRQLKQSRGVIDVLDPEYLRMLADFIDTSKC